MHATHKTISIEVGSRKADIDEIIAPLIKEMWQAWIETEESCQEYDNDGKVYLFLPTLNDLKRFLKIVANNYEIGNMESIYRKVIVPFDRKDREDNWIFNLEIDDENICNVDEGSNFRFGIHILFPQSDLPMVIEKFKKFNCDNQAIKT